MSSADYESILYIKNKTSARAWDVCSEARRYRGRVELDELLMTLPSPKARRRSEQRIQWRDLCAYVFGPCGRETPPQTSAEAVVLSGREHWRASALAAHSFVPAAVLLSQILADPRVRLLMCAGGQLVLGPSFVVWTHDSLYACPYQPDSPVTQGAVPIRKFHPHGRISTQVSWKRRGAFAFALPTQPIVLPQDRVSRD